MAVDGEVLPRACWETFALPEDARVEVLTAMQEDGRRVPDLSESDRTISMVGELGGQPQDASSAAPQDALTIAGRTLRSRLLLGTGRVSLAGVDGRGDRGERQ